MADREELARLAGRFVSQREELGDRMWPSPPLGALDVRPSQPADTTSRKSPTQPMASAGDEAKDTPPPKREPAPDPEPDVQPVPTPGEVVSEVPIEYDASADQRLPDLPDTIPDPAIWGGLSLESFGEAISGCARCDLGKARQHFVFGVGNPDADIFFIGEAPGADEDAQGIPFVGRAGQLLTRMIDAMKLSRDDVYIANILKCRPPNNRNPLPTEIRTCMPYLEHQIRLVKPRFVCALGRVAAQTLLETSEGLSRLRGRWHQWMGVRVIVTYHPAALLRNPAWKRDAWDDLKLLRYELDGVEL